MSDLSELDWSCAGRIVAVGDDNGPKLPAYIYIPARRRARAPLLVSVHGYARNALSHALRMRSLAERLGAVCVVPFFSRPRHPRYQVLAAGRGGEQPDLALHMLLDSVRLRLDIAQEAANWFGFSGGGQFLHRFALRHPQYIGRAVIAAAGWYTFPDPEMDWPLGIASSPWQLPLGLDCLLNKPLLVVVGEYDTQADETLNRKAVINAQQGAHRVERGTRWVEAMQAAARSRGLPERVRFCLLPGVGHSFEAAMDGEHLEQHLLEHFHRPEVGADASVTPTTLRISV